MTDKSEIEEVQNNPDNLEEKKSGLRAFFMNIKIKQALERFKKPKLLTLGILAITVIVVVLALNLMSQKQKEELAPPPAQTVVEQPSPSTDPSLENIKERINTYSDRLDSLGNIRKNLTYPIVDLEISF